MSDASVIGTIRRAIRIETYPAGANPATDAPTEIQEQEWYYESDGVTVITDPDRIAAIQTRQRASEEQTT